MTINTVPQYTGDAPNRQTQNQTTFSNNVGDTLGYLLGFTDDLNVSIGQMNTDIEQVNLDAQTAQNAANIAVSETNFVGNWSDQTGAFAVNQTVYDDGANWRSATNIVDITASKPGIANTDWVLSSVPRIFKPITSVEALLPFGLYSIKNTSGSTQTYAKPTIETGAYIVLHNELTSTATVRFNNAGGTIVGKGRTLNSSDNLILEPGDTVNLLAVTTDNLEIV